VPGYAVIGHCYAIKWILHGLDGRQTSTRSAPRKSLTTQAAFLWNSHRQNEMFLPRLTEPEKFRIVHFTEPQTYFLNLVFRVGDNCNFSSSASLLKSIFPLGFNRPTV
jgi:hypothetical protein